MTWMVGRSKYLKRLQTAWLAAILLLAAPGAASAQAEALELRLNRDWGYGGLNGEIEGRFSMIASGPQELVEVRFLIDGETVGVDSEAPFRFQFETGQYAPGQHALSARGMLADGREIASGEIVRVFLSAEQAGQKTFGLVIPILVLALAVGAGSALLPLVLGRGKKHIPGQYGLAGGAVCPRCRFPFARSMMAPNLLVGKLARCPHCGRWSLAARASRQALEAAEERLAAEGSPQVAAAESEKDKLERLIDESRFED